MALASSVSPLSVEKHCKTLSLAAFNAFGGSALTVSTIHSDRAYVAAGSSLWGRSRNLFFNDYPDTVVLASVSRGHEFQCAAPACWAATLLHVGVPRVKTRLGARGAGQAWATLR